MELKTTAVKMANVLKSCLDTVQGRMNEINKFRATLTRIGATWPAIPEAPDVFTMAAKVFETFRLSPLVRIRTALYSDVVQGGRSLSIEPGDALSAWIRRREYLQHGVSYRRYYDSAVELYSTDSRSIVTFDDFFAIEREVTLNLAHSSRENHKVSSFSTVQAVGDHVDKKYVQRLQELLTSVLGLPAAAVVKVRDLGYFKRFIKAIEDIGEKKLQLYMGWITLQAMWRVLGKQFSKLWYDSTGSGFGLQRPYRADCLEFVESVMGWAAYEPFGRENAGSSVQAAVRVLTRSVSEAFLREHNLGRWSVLLRRPPVTDADFSDTLYHNVRVTEEKLNEVFANVSITVNSFFDNWIAITRAMSSATEEQLQDVRSEYMAVLREAGNYTLLDRYHELIRVPPLFSMLPLFHADSIDAANYGSFGVLLGAAATRLFTDRVRREGNPVLTAELDRRLGCFLQGSSFRHHRDVVHRSVAVDVVLKAWKTSSGSTTPQRLRNYTAAKAFFVAMCYLLCVPKKAPSEPVARANCNEAVRNSDAFVEAFGCGPSAPMHSTSNCELFAR
ncbi:endothelin-converting enzyme 1-like [Amblyomma americanum]